MLENVLNDPTEKVWEVNKDREGMVQFLNNFLIMTEDILESTDQDPRFSAIRELANMALLEFAGNGPMSSYAEAIFHLCTAFSTEEY